MSRPAGDRQMSVRDRMGLFQTQTAGAGGGGGGRGAKTPVKVPPSPTNRASTADSAKGFSHAPGSRPYHLPSHCDALFGSLCALREAGLLLDCSLLLHSTTFRVHRLLLAALSGCAQAWLLSAGERLRVAQPVSAAGLQAVVDFAYSGQVGAATEEVQEACRGLGAERLAQLYTGGAGTSQTIPDAANERERSLQVIKDLWERGIACDLVLKTEREESFPVHRVVLAAGGAYFRALLCGGMRESGEGVVMLRGVCGWVLQMLLAFLYSGTLWLSEDTVWELTEAALQYQLQGALSLCQDFLRAHMDVQSCLDVLALAEAYGLQQLGQQAEQFILRNFQRVSAGDKFRDLPADTLEHLLQNDTLSVDSEVAVFRAVLCWVQEDRPARLQYLPRLLQEVRFPLMCGAELQEVQGCRLMTEEALEAVRLLLHSACKPRTPNQVLVLVGGDCVDDDLARRSPSCSLWFARRFLRGEGLIREVEWRPLPPLPPPPRLRHCVCVLHNRLYVLGGRKYYGARDILQSALRFDPAQEKWERLADMLSARDYFAAVCLRGKVYALGGNRDDSHYLDSVEVYTPEDNTWRCVHPLATPVCGHAAAVLNGCIYISGGCDSGLRCLPSLWRYNPEQGCTDLAPMRAGPGRAGHAMQAVGGLLCVAGGVQPVWGGFRDQLQCEAYDPALDAWTPLPCLPRPHLSPASALLGEELYLLGGSSADSARDTPWVHRYNSRTCRWDRLGAMPRPYSDLAACTLQLPGGCFSQ
ncbi:kelch-like protein 33 [Megalops cyprinoides]|uniref:kelch-like protein 33 n=1 Tax=Megalops cyprinoides TaxID=118141 RepID=UPI0018643D1B|nr:kelch-like protein 33 [Megalops cyprinoides]